MEKDNRTWMVKTNKGETEGPYTEEQFQEQLRAGNIPFYYQIKSDEMNDWRPILEVVSEDISFRRPSTIPPPPAKN